MKTPKDLITSLFYREPRVSWIIIGIGNPGPKYLGTRHNIGHVCVDQFATLHSISVSKKHGLATVGEGKIHQQPIILSKSNSFVNQSGNAVISLLSRYKVSKSHLLIILDDMELPVGGIRLRRDGGSGGHNGLRSIIDSLGTQEFARLRIGIGRPGHGNNEIEHVLGKPQNGELQAIDVALQSATKAINCLISEGIDAAMNQFN